jgi:peptide/nickel transport system substrate-binding protein
MRLFGTAFAISAIALTVAACSSSGNSTSPSQPGTSAAPSNGVANGSTAPASKTVSNGTFTMSMDSDPGNLDPQASAASNLYQLNQFAYDPLVYEDANGKIMSGLASKWQVTGTKATFTLHSGITCSDGGTFTAQDAAANIAYVGDPKNKSPYLGVYLPVGSKAKASGNTLTITTPQTAPFLINALANLPMVCKKGMANRKLLARGTDGTGPYQLSKQASGDSITYTRRDGYSWGPNGQTTKTPGLPQTIVVKIVQNETTAANLLLSGGLTAGIIRGADTSRLDAAHLYKSGVTAVAGEMWFNQATGRPAADPAVRQALTEAVDLGQLEKVLTSNKGTPGTTFAAFPPTACPGNSVASALPAHNLDKAKQDLDTAGWKAGPGGTRQKNGKKLALTFVYTNSAGSASSAAAELATQTWKSLGVDITAKSQDDAAINQTVFSTGNWDISWVQLNVNSPDQLVPFLSGPAPSSGTNFAHIANSTYSHLIAKASTEVGKAGCPDWLNAESALVKDADVIPFANQLTYAYGNHATFQIWGAIAPLTIRMLAS